MWQFYKHGTESYYDNLLVENNHCLNTQKRQEIFEQSQELLLDELRITKDIKNKLNIIYSKRVKMYIFELLSIEQSIILLSTTKECLIYSKIDKEEIFNSILRDREKQFNVYLRDNFFLDKG